MTDWAPGTSIRPHVVTLTFKPDGSVGMIGVNYDVTLPSGAIAGTHASDWTPPANHRKALQKAMDQLLADLAAATGTTITPGPVQPPTPPPVDLFPRPA